MALSESILQNEYKALDLLTDIIPGNVNKITGLEELIRVSTIIGRMIVDYKRLNRIYVNFLMKND